MTRLEMQALLLASELEQFIKHHNVTTGLTLALNEFRKAQDKEQKRIGADLEAMYQQYVNSNLKLSN
ncbi:MAG: hypothetical protein ACAH17_03640 [Candidatus Paceibacterota bacterium]